MGILVARDSRGSKGRAIASGASNHVNERMDGHIKIRRVPELEALSNLLQKDYLHSAVVPLVPRRHNQIWRCASRSHACLSPLMHGGDGEQPTHKMAQSDIT